MSTSSKGGSPGARRRGGFTLVEALVALVVAGFLVPSLARALGGAWTATRTPLEVVSAMILARDVLSGDPVPAEARGLGFGVERTGGAVTVLALPADVAPAPPGTGKDDASDLKPEATPAAIRLAAPKGFGAPPPGTAPTANLRLQRVSVVVRTPSGRRLGLDGVRLDDGER